VGVTVSNAQAAGAVHPSINMAVPATVLVSPITDFVRTGGWYFLAEYHALCSLSIPLIFFPDESVLKSLCPNDPEVTREWMLQTLPPSRL